MTTEKERISGAESPNDEAIAMEIYNAGARAIGADPIASFDHTNKCGRPRALAELAKARELLCPPASPPAKVGDVKKLDIEKVSRIILGKPTEESTIGEIGRAVDAAADVLSHIDGELAKAQLTAKNWEIAYDKAMRERDTYAGQAHAYVQACNRQDRELAKVREELASVLASELDEITTIKNERDEAKAIYEGRFYPLANQFCENAGIAYDGDASIDRASAITKAMQSQVADLRSTVEAQAEEIATLKRDIEALKAELAAATKRVTKLIEAAAEVEADMSSHDEYCDAVQLGPDLGPSTKPCNCRRKVCG
jgi:predicted  nucleic acid-binding Zn-ribbon protein